MSDIESDLPPELDVDLNNILDNAVSETNLVNPEASANNDDDVEDKPISTLVEDEDEQEKPVEKDSKVENDIET